MCCGCVHCLQWHRVGTEMTLGWHRDDAGLAQRWHWFGIEMALVWHRDGAGLAQRWRCTGTGMAPATAETWQGLQALLT